MAKVNRLYLIAAIAVIGKSTPHRPNTPGTTLDVLILTSTNCVNQGARCLASTYRPCRP
jgi:hypothetical protein